MIGSLRTSKPNRNVLRTWFPHYFERYLTDGVDYNIYVGASLVPDDSFDPIFLRNLRFVAAHDDVRQSSGNCAL